MDPENPLPVTEEVPQSQLERPPRRTTYLFVVLGVFLSVAVIFLGLQYVPQRPPQENPDLNKVPPTPSFWTYEYQPLHMRVTLKDSWKEIPAGSVSLPQDVTGERFAFRKSGTSCVLVYVTAPEEVFGNYSDVTDGMAAAGAIKTPQVLDRISNENLASGPFSISAYMLDERASFLSEQVKLFKEQSAKGESWLPISFYDAGIIFASSHFSEFKESSKQSPMFVLFDDGSTDPWDPLCLSDMVKVIENIDWLYEPITLTEDSKGLLYITSESAGGGREVDHVRFISEETNIPTAVMDINATANPMSQVVNGQWYMVIEGELRTLDPFSKSTERVLNNDASGSAQVQAFVVEDDKVVYLAGGYCLSYLKKCDLTLYEYDRVTQQSTKLADHLPYREIVGYDRNTQEILMAYREGDGSCRSWQTGIYSYQVRQVQDVRALTSCSTNEFSGPDYDAIQADLKRFTKVIPTHDHINVMGGELVRPVRVSPLAGRNWSFAYP